METTVCTHNIHHVHRSLHGVSLCVNEIYDAEKIINDVILLQNIFKLEIVFSCLHYSVLMTRDEIVRIGFIISKYEVIETIGVNSNQKYCKDINELIEYLDAKFPNLRRENCSKMAIK